MMADAAKTPAPKKPYTMVRRSLWDSRRFASLPDDLHRYLYLYLLTCPHQGGAGCFRGKDAYMLADLAKTGSDWTAEILSRRMTALVESGLIMADDTTREILIVGWWKDCPPTNDKWFKGARRYCEAIESTRLKEHALAALAECGEALLSAKGYPPRTNGSHPVGLPTAADRVAAVQVRLGGAA